jgi:hypothetical protein
MAIAVEVISDSSIDRYFEGLKKLGATPEGRHPDSACLFHWVTKTEDGGWRVIDVWRTKEQCQRFIEEKVGPVMAEMGVPRAAGQVHRGR